MNIPRVENMRSPSSHNNIANQFLIYTDKGAYFQSYQTVIAFEPYGKKIVLDPDHEYSRTTMKYLAQFLGHGIAETRKRIERKEYIVKSLN